MTYMFETNSLYPSTLQVPRITKRKSKKPKRYTLDMHVQTCAATAAEMLKSLASRDEHHERTDGPGWLGG